MPMKVSGRPVDVSLELGEVWAWWEGKGIRELGWREASE